MQTRKLALSLTPSERLDFIVKQKIKFASPKMTLCVFSKTLIIAQEIKVVRRNPFSTHKYDQKLVKVKISISKNFEGPPGGA